MKIEIELTALQEGVLKQLKCNYEYSDGVLELQDKDYEKLKHIALYEPYGDGGHKGFNQDSECSHFIYEYQCEVLEYIEEDAASFLNTDVYDITRGLIYNPEHYRAIIARQILAEVAHTIYYSNTWEESNE